VDPESPEALERVAGMQEHAEQLFASKTTDDWIEFLDARTVACGRVLNVLEMFDHPHLLANEMVIEYEDPFVGPVRGLGYPMRFEKTPMEMQRPAPPTGADTDEILAWLGHDAEAIGRLRERPGGL
jgi:formyl-CoA transferase